MKIAFKVLSILIFCFAITQPSRAALLFEGSFAADFSTLPSISGSFSLLFDDSAVTGVGAEIFFNQTLESLSVTPNPLLGFDYNTSNTFANVFFFDGLLAMNIGGANAGSCNEYVGDFCVDFLGTPPAISLVGLAGGQGVETGFNAIGELSITPVNVPVPATLALFGLGLAGLGFSRRKKA